MSLPKPNKGEIQGSRKWYALELSEDEAELSIFDEIGGWFGKSVKEFKLEFDEARKKKHIKVLLNSPGGDVFDGMALYNILAGVREKVSVEVLGVAASMASVIALSGRELIMDEGSYLMIHQPWSFVVGDAAELRRNADILEKIGGQLANIYASRSSLTREEVEEKMNAETWFTAEEAEEAGFATEVVDNGQIAAMAFDFSKYRHVPERVRSLAVAPPPAKNEEPAPVGGEGEGMDTETVTVSSGSTTTLAPEIPVAALVPEKAQTEALQTELDEVRALNKALIGEKEALKKANEQLSAALEAERKEKREKRKADALGKALAEGRIAPVDRDFWSGRYDADPDGTDEILAKMPANINFRVIGSGAGSQEEGGMLLFTERQRNALKHGLKLSDEKIAELEKEGA